MCESPATYPSRTLSFCAATPLVAHAHGGAVLPSAGFVWPLNASVTVSLVALVIVLAVGIFLTAQTISRQRRSRSAEADTYGPERVAGSVGTTVADAVTRAWGSALGGRRESEAPQSASPPVQRSEPGAQATPPAPAAEAAPQAKREEPPFGGMPGPAPAPAPRQADEAKEASAPAAAAPAPPEPVAAATPTGSGDATPAPETEIAASPAWDVSQPAPIPPGEKPIAAAPPATAHEPAAPIIEEERARGWIEQPPTPAPHEDGGSAADATVTAAAPHEERDENLAQAGEPLADGQPQPEPVQFTALYPKEVPVATWNTLLVYTHLASSLPALRADALKFRDEIGTAPRASHAQAGQQVARGTELTLVPRCAGVTFNPERVTFQWVEDLHRAEFRFQVAPELAGSAGNGEIAVYAGPLIVATLTIAMLFDEPGIPPPTRQEVEVTANLYKQIFVSYSRKDTPVVVACRNAYRALGITVNMDVDSLRSGEVFDESLMRLIDGSDVFQLFWSEHSAESEYVREEWEYALGRSKGPGFIRPVYWERPMVPPPPELARVHFAYVDLPELETPDGQAP
jgi:hypothetical protein